MTTTYETACEIHEHEIALNAKYTPEFRLEAVRLSRCEPGISAAAATLRISEHTLRQWIDADSQSNSSTHAAGHAESAEQIEISRLKCELTLDKMERDVATETKEYFEKQRG